MSVQLAALLCNIALAIMKFVVGALAGSRALIADAFNSTGDVVATLVAWLAFRYGARPPDEDHPYGHGNAETLAGLLIGGMICATGAFIFVDGLVAAVVDPERVAPDRFAIWATLVTAGVKEVLYRVSMTVGRRNNSPTLLASARDHRADVFASLVALLGILVANLGWPAFDAIAATAIGVYIFFLGLKPVRDNTAILMHEAPPELTRTVSRLAAAVPGVMAVTQVRVQPLGGSHRVDMILQVDGELSVADAHELAHRVEGAVLANDGSILEVHVHVEPHAAPGRT